MALPTEEMREIVRRQWLKKMSPIWPNLVKKETGFDYPKRDKRFFAFLEQAQRSVSETVCIPKHMHKEN